MEITPREPPGRPGEREKKLAKTTEALREPATAAALEDRVRENQYLGDPDLFEIPQAIDDLAAFAPVVFRSGRAPHVNDGVLDYAERLAHRLLGGAVERFRDRRERALAPDSNDDGWGFRAFARERLEFALKFEENCRDVYAAYESYRDEERRPASKRNRLTSWLRRAFRVERRHANVRDYYVGLRLKRAD